MTTANVLPALRSSTERNALVLEHQHLVTWVWKKRGHEKLLRQLGRDDAIGAGQLGLIRAAELWDPSIATFSTYAPQWIYNRMQMAAAANLQISVPRRYLYGKAAANCIVASQSAGRIIRIDQVTGESDGDPEWSPFVARKETHPWDVEGWEEFQEALRFVHPVYRDLLWAHFYDGLTYEEIARPLGISRECVRKQIERGLRRLYRQMGLTYPE